MARPATDLGPDHSLILALLEYPFGATTKDIATRLSISLSTAARRLTAARWDDWLLTPDAHGRPVRPTGEAPRNTRWLLNLDRPGANALLTYLRIEHGADVSTYRQRLADPYRLYERAFEDHLLHPHTGRSDVDKIQAALAGIDPWLHPRIFRALYADLAHVHHTPARLEDQAQRLYSGAERGDGIATYPDRRRERYRDYIHRMIHLREELPALPEEPDRNQNARPHLVVLARAAENTAQVLTEEADFFAASDALGFELHRLTERLATHLHENGTYGKHLTITDDEADQAETDYTALTQRIEDGHPTPDGRARPYLRYGGAPSTVELGTAAEGLIALELRTQAEAALAVRDQIFALDGMTEAAEIARKILA